MTPQKLEQKDLYRLTALQPPDWDSIVPHFEYYLDSPFCFPIRIEIDNNIVALGTTILNEDTAWLAHIIVHPLFRKKGLGKLITEALVKSIDGNVFKTIYLISSGMGSGVYTSIGFETETDYVLLLKDGNSLFSIHPDVKPFNENHRDAIFKLDRYASGESRSGLFSGYLSNAFIFEKDGHLSGFYLPTYADGMIIADNEVAGIELMKLRLQNNHLAILPSDNKKGIQFLENNDFREYKSLKRMRLGKYREWHPKLYFNRISGQVG